jgi:cytochrome c biogenesis protein
VSVGERLDPGLSPPAEPEPPPGRGGLGVLGWARWAWRLLTSMRTALVLLFLLALAAVPGSVFPQRGVVPADVAAFARESPAAYRVLDALSMFEVYSSPWFSAVYLLLFASLVGCVLPRTRQHWRAVRARPPRAPRHLVRLPQHRTFPVAAADDVVLDRARTVLRQRRYRVEPGDGAVAAERGQLRETGNLLFHGALVVVLVAVALGHLYGFRGNVVVVEGDGFANVPGAYDSVQAGPRFDESTLEPFALTLDRFSVRYQEGGQQSGAPRDFRAEVTYRQAPGGPPRQAVIASNSPLTVGGTRAFLTGNGYAPRFTVRDGTGQVVVSGPVPFLPRDGNMTSEGVVKAPDARPEQLGIEAAFLPTAFVDPAAGPVSVFPDVRAPRVFLTVWRGDLGLDDGVPQSVYRLDTTGMEQVRDPVDAAEPFAVALAPGETVELPDGLGSVTFDGVDRFVNLQVARDPGGTPALTGAVLAIVGLTMSLFVRRRRVWVRARGDAGGRTVVEVAGLSRTDDEGLAEEVDAVVERLRAALGAAGDGDPTVGGQTWAPSRSRS